MKWTSESLKYEWLAYTLRYTYTCSIFFRSDPLIAFPFFDTSTLLNGFFFSTRKRLIMRMKYIIIVNEVYWVHGHV